MVGWVGNKVVGEESGATPGCCGSALWLATVLALLISDGLVGCWFHGLVL